MKHAASTLALLLVVAAPGAALAGDLPGKLLLESRLRYEAVDQEGPLDEAQALTLRTRLGWESPAFADFKLLAEVENVSVLIDDYNDPNDPDPRYPTVNDSEVTDLNRLQLTWTGLKDTEVVIGRQRLSVGNQRFIGPSNWRQNDQSFEAIKATTSALKPVSFTYIYADRIQRTLGPDHPQGVWHGEVHFLQAEMATPVGKLSAFGLRTDIDESPANSTQTFDLRLAGDHKLSGKLKATWELEYARQSDYAANPRDYTVDYRLASAGLTDEAWSAALVYEQLEGNGVVGFQTPLGSGHGVQGWSDVIGATPTVGIRDVFLRGQYKAPVFGKGLKLTSEAHDFKSSDGDIDLGREFDLSAALPLNKQWTVELKAATFDAASLLYRDTTKAWFILEYKY
jgi:hypothetical protein